MKIPKLHLFLILSIFFSLQSISSVFGQTTHYVSVTGSDVSGTGLIDNPYLTLQYALNQCNDGDEVIMRGGNYTSAEIRINNNNITIKSYDGEWAIITAPIDNEDIAECIWYHEPQIIGGTLERLEIIGGYYYAVKFESDWNWGAPIADRRGVSNITIKNCIIHGSGRDCLKLTPACDNILIESCNIYDSGIGPANEPDPNAEGIDAVNCDNLTVKNCYIHNTSTTGFYSKGGSINTLMEGNLVMNCGGNGLLLGFYTDEEWFDADENPILYENINGTIRNNIIINTQYDGIGMYAALNPKIYNNTVINSAQTDHASLFINTGYIWVEALNDMYAPPCRDIDVQNNIFMFQSASERPVVQIRYYEDDISTNMLGTNIINNNLLYEANGVTFDNGINEVMNFATWKTTTGFDASSLEANPLLDANYHLSGSSPCINTGATISAVAFDYDGGTRSGAYDIGADEYNSGVILVIPPTGIGTGGQTATNVVCTEKPSTINLTQNAPNPFVNNTRFILQTASGKTVHLTLIDITGKIVSNIYSGFLSEGAHEFEIDANGLKTGIYYYKVEFDNQKIVKKLMKL
jgi:parallel beta-helix repeat protein